MLTGWSRRDQVVERNTVRNANPMTGKYAYYAYATSLCE